MSDEKALVGVLMGSKSDAEVMKGCNGHPSEMKIPHEVRVLSSASHSQQTREYAEKAASRGIHVMIAGAGWAAHLAGVIAAHTTLPVIGVPIDPSPLQGMDSLLSTVSSMPPGIPVATVSIGRGGATNAAVLAAEILAPKFPDIAERLKAYREGLTRKALETGEGSKLRARRDCLIGFDFAFLVRSSS